MSTSVIEKRIYVTMDNGEVWSVPVRVIAMSRARHYASEYGGDVERSLREDTIPLMESERDGGASVILDWLHGETNWSDVVNHTRREPSPVRPTNYADGWFHGPKEIR